MRWTLHKQAAPFTLTDGLKAHLAGHPEEHGTQEGLGEQFHAGVTVWRISDSAGRECGYAWWIPTGDHPRRRQFTLAVFEPFRSQGAGAAALRVLEREAALAGVTALRAQVNTNGAKAGFTMRRWLWRRGYRLLGRQTGDSHAMADEEELNRAPGPVFLQKFIARPVTRPPRSAAPITPPGTGLQTPVA